MLKRIKRYTWRVLRSMGLAGYVVVFVNSMLTQRKWFRTFNRQASVDANGQPIPWLNYAFLHFLESRLQPHYRLFEYGSGSSTLWFSSRIQEVVSVESSRMWYAKISRQLPGNASLTLLEDEQAYAQHIQMQDGLFDLILIDGISRSLCAQQCLSKLGPAGVIIFDNTDIDAWAGGIAHLQANGFRQLEFKALAAGVSLETCTSVFYRDENCLHI
ncbi:MAG: FkbM family methyltransferase [Bacteroidetes bacterium]|nr:FkbM family methyltransferase [Bacteroidota bacterium]